MFGTTIILFCWYDIAPSAAPSSVTATDVTSSSITVQWGEVPCIHQNGDITGYSVQYEVMGSGNTMTMAVDGADTTETTIESLSPNTIYNITVAAVNTEGTGVGVNISAGTVAGTFTVKTFFCGIKIIIF